MNPGRSTPYVQKWRAENPERNRRLNAPTESKRERDRARYRSDARRREAVLRRFKELNARRPEIKNAITARRRAIHKRAAVAWADRDRIREFYVEAKRLERELGIKHEVDHIVPLQSPIVCGLHVEHNLRVIPRFENIIKGNRVWPDMPV